MSQTINVLIADDHKMFTTGLKVALESSGLIRVEEIVSDGKELLSVLKPDMKLIVLLDINMPYLNGLDASLKIAQQYPSIRIIILSTYHEGHLIQKAKQYGCKGYVVKTAEIPELIVAIQQVESGGEYFHHVSQESVSEHPSTDDLVKKFQLTRRELEILDLLRQELTNKEISEKLFLSIYTIETHRKNIMQKLGLKTPAALLKFFLSNGNV